MTAEAHVISPDLKAMQMTIELPKMAIELPLDDNGIVQAATHSKPPPTGWSRLFLIPLLMATLFTGAVIGMYFQPPGLRVFFNATGLEPGAGTHTPIALAIAQVEAQEQIAVVSEGDIVALGRIIPFGDVSSVATPSGAGDARIAELRVDVGQEVAQGDVLAVLDNLPQLQAGVASATAVLRVRDANLTQTQTSIAASRAEASASLERAQVTARVGQTDLARATSLFESGLTTRADFDQIVARASEALRDEERDIATLSRYDTGSQIVQADIAVAEANLEAARADLTRATQDL